MGQPANRQPSFVAFTRIYQSVNVQGNSLACLIE
jgi:hypothetical protein